MIMDEPTRLDLEGRIHALLCDGLEPAARLDLLAQVAHDDEARRLLGEMVAIQRQARQACGQEAAEGTMARSLAALLDNVAQDAGLAAERQPDNTTLALPRGPRVRPGLSVFAAVAAAAAVLIAVVALQRTMGPGDQPAPRAQPIPPVVVSATELANYREMFRRVADGAGDARPWMLLADGAGRFGYLPTATGAPATRLILFRCQLVNAQGEVLETLNVIVPAQEGLRLSLAEAGRLADQPVHCEIAPDASGATCTVLVGNDPAAGTGVRGRVIVGEGPVDVGRFRVDGHALRVVFQALAIDSAASRT
jgi:hypothetical protein